MKFKDLLIIGLLFAFLFLTGCVSGLLETVPNAEFTRFSYNRSGNFTSASIEANEGRINDGVLEVKSLSILENWGPVVNFSLYLEGYKRELE